MKAIGLSSRQRESHYSFMVRSSERALVISNQGTSAIFGLSRLRTGRLALLALVAGMAFVCPGISSSAAANPEADNTGKSLVPLHLHPDNPRYVVFQGQPTVFISSGEHYGAVMNEAWHGDDHRTYLDELQRDGLNLTRVFSGAYRERFNHLIFEDSLIPMPPNTLGPVGGEYRVPWARSDTQGYADGGNKFDLERWDPMYFQRLRHFVSEAEQRGIAVEFTFFGNLFTDLAGGQLLLSPLHISNNINGVGDVDYISVHTLDNDGLLPYQEAMVRKVVTELNSFDNVYYEIINEPDIAKVGDAYLEWQDHMIDTIVEIEASLPMRHLVAVNAGVGGGEIADPHPEVSIFNFHFNGFNRADAGPETLAINSGIPGMVAYDETVFFGVADTPYRTQAWDFIVSGGGVFNHTDYSFTPGDPTGSERPRELVYPPGSLSFPSMGMGGGPEIREQLGFLKRFVMALPFVEMTPADELIGDGPGMGTARVFAKHREVYVVYLNAHGQDTPPLEYRKPDVHRESMTLKVPSGRYQTRWFDPATGELVQQEIHQVSSDETLTLESPSFSDDVVVLAGRPGEFDLLVPYYGKQ